MTCMQGILGEEVNILGGCSIDRSGVANLFVLTCQKIYDYRYTNVQKFGAPYIIYVNRTFYVCAVLLEILFSYTN